MNDSGIQPHPEVRRLIEENEMLGEELAQLLTEAEDLIHTVKPNLLAIYQTKIGVWELRHLRAQFKVARLRRQIELAQAGINRGERPDVIAIECAIEQEFLTWMTKLQEAAERIQAAETRLKSALSPTDDREIKKLYYAIVKRLHPDVNANITDDQRRLWSRVQEAYERGDLTEMRALSLLVERTMPIAPAKSLDNLRRDQKILEKQLISAMKNLEQIESNPPLTLRPQLEDDAWVSARREEIDHQAAALNQHAAALQAHWDKLLSNAGYGTTFSQN